MHELSDRGIELCCPLLSKFGTCNPLICFHHSLFPPEMCV